MCVCVCVCVCVCESCVCVCVCVCVCPGLSLVMCLRCGRLDSCCESGGDGKETQRGAAHIWQVHNPLSLPPPTPHHQHHHHPPSLLQMYLAAVFCGSHWRETQWKEPAASWVQSGGRILSTCVRLMETSWFFSASRPEVSRHSRAASGFSV